MKRRLLALLLVVTALVQIGATRGRAYRKVHDEYTRELFVYQGFATALILRGTLLTGPMREAMIEARARLVDPLPEDQAEYVAEMAEALETYHEVVFSADSGLPRGDEFSAEGEGWHVRLEADGTIEPLVTVYQVRKPSMLQRTLFPHYNIWSDLWVARFHRTVADPEVVELHVGSGYGHGRLRWDDLR